MSFTFSVASTSTVRDEKSDLSNRAHLPLHKNRRPRLLLNNGEQACSRLAELLPSSAWCRAIQYHHCPLFGVDVSETPSLLASSVLASLLPCFTVRQLVGFHILFTFIFHSRQNIFSLLLSLVLNIRFFSTFFPLTNAFSLLSTFFHFFSFLSTSIHFIPFLFTSLHFISLLSTSFHFTIIFKFTCSFKRSENVVYPFTT